MTRKIARTDPRRSTVGERLRTARLATGRTQDEVAALLGITRTAVSGQESGRRIASWPDWVDQVVRLGYDLRIVAPELIVSQARIQATDAERGTESNFPTMNLFTSQTPEPVDTQRDGGIDNPSKGVDSSIPPTTTLDVHGSRG